MTAVDVDVDVDGRRITLSNLDKVLYPAAEPKPVKAAKAPAKAPAKATAARKRKSA